MKIIKPSVTVLKPFTLNESKSLMKLIETAGRTCYKSNKSQSGDADSFVKRLIKSGHHSVLEHVTATLLFVCDRGVSHELARHRIGSYSQESTRYCNYSQDRFDNEITVIEPLFWSRENVIGNMDKSYCKVTWEDAMYAAEAAYFELLRQGATPQEARSVLPNSLKTEVVVTFNLREWRHFFNLRYVGTTGAPHPQMREVAGMALQQLKELFPVVFDDIVYEERPRNWEQALELVKVQIVEAVKSNNGDQ